MAKTKRRTFTDDELISAVYCRIPEDQRLAKDITELDEHARQVWLGIAKKYLANGDVDLWNRLTKGKTANA